MVEPKPTSFQFSKDLNNSKERKPEDPNKILPNENLTPQTGEDQILNNPLKKPDLNYNNNDKQPIIPDSNSPPKE